MSDFFPSQIKQSKNIPLFMSKLQSFEVQIRKSDRRKKLQQMRDMSELKYKQKKFEIQTLINNLPRTLDDVILFITLNQAYFKSVSKLLIDRIYEQQLRGIQEKEFRFSLHNKIDCSESYILLPGQISNFYQIHNSLFLLNLLLKYQPLYSQLLMSKYFEKIFTISFKFNQQIIIPALLNSINIIIKNRELNWVPLKQLALILKRIQEHLQFKVLKDQIETYFALSQNYIKSIFDLIQIRIRLKNILKNSTQILEFVPSRTFFKLCINLTYYQNSLNPCELSQKNQFTFYDSLLEGDIYKIVLRNIIFAADNKIRLLCLDLLQNLIFQLGSQEIWKSQKLNPIEHFETEIKNKNNDYRTFQAFSQVFLYSIIMIPHKQLLENVVQGDFDSIQIIQYILENLETENHALKQSVANCLLMLLTDCIEKSQRKIAYILLQNDWVKLLGEQDELYKKVQQITNEKIQ